MTEDIRNRFAAVMAPLRATSETVKSEHEAAGRFRKRGAKEQDNTTQASTRTDIENTAAYQILVDASLDPKEKAEKIAALLFFNEEDLEANGKAIAENHAVVAQLLKDFTEHNKQSIILTRDNPLSELRTGIREVFEKYHELVSGREDLKEKLGLIDSVISKHGGPEGLIKALLSAKEKESQKESLDKGLIEARVNVEDITGQVQELGAKSKIMQMEITENESDSFLFFKGDKKRKIREDKQRRSEIEADLVLKRQDLSSANEALEAKTREMYDFVSNEDYKVHQQILEILDIGTEDFKEKLRSLSDVTLSYIDDTSKTLEGVRLQLESLLNRVTNVHTMTQNTVENVSIILEAQEKAQQHNIVKLKAIESEEVAGGVAAMKREKKLRSLNQHVSAVEKTTQSTASVAGELGKVQIGLTNFKDQMQEGLADAMEQQMMAVGSAAATGNATLMRIETLATFVQGLVTKGQYMQESEYHLGEIAKEMERSLMARMAKNEGIRNVADVLKEMTSAMDDRNDVVLQIAEDRKALIDRLIDQTKELGRTNEEALAIESAVNKKLYGDDKGRNGQSGAGAPALGLG